MPDFGHAEKMLAQMTNPDERKTWERILKSSEPFPTFLGGYNLAAEIAPLFVEEDPLWMQKMGYGENRYYPVPGYIYAVAPASDIHADREIGTRLQESQRELFSMGVNTVKRTRRDADDFFPSQHYLFLPRMRPPRDGEKGPQTDFDGAVMFLAYLLHKGYLKKDDFKRIRVTEYGNTIETPLTSSGFHPYQDIAMPFSHSMLEFALSDTYQNRVRQGLGEPLLPESKQPQKSWNRPRNPSEWSLE